MNQEALFTLLKDDFPLLQLAERYEDFSEKYRLLSFRAERIDGLLEIEVRILEVGTHSTYTIVKISN